MMYPYPSYVAPRPSYDGGVEKHILNRELYIVLEGLRGVILQKERIEIRMIIDNTYYFQNLFYRMVFVPFS